LKERYRRVARYFDPSYHPQTAIFAAQFNVDKYAKAEQLDGCYLLKTDRIDLSGDELWRIYILLTRAENAFRDMKSPIAERPIFHHTERRTEAHIFLCVLAYLDRCRIGKHQDALSRCRASSAPSAASRHRSCYIY